MKLIQALTVLSLGIGAVAVFPLHSSAQTAPAYYTTAQAATGATVYAAQCSMCHGASLQGESGPSLAGADFLKKWSGQTADDVHYIASTQMPLTAPASLKPAEYLAIMAYILQKNNFPAGDTALTAPALKTIKFK